jgi:hypothetical protein
MTDAYVIHIKFCETFEKAERRFIAMRQPAALIRFIDGTGGVALLDTKPVFEGQRPFNAGHHEVRRKVMGLQR